MAKILASTVTSLALVLSSVVAVNAATNPTATNGTVTVSSDANGNLLATKGATTTTVNSILTKNGVSNITYTNGKFIATSFFNVAYSSDGYTWSSSFVPVGDKFKPTNIISDANFFAKGPMDASQIQSFMESKVSCVNGYCLKDYKETTFNRAADVICSAYTGATNESAASIIAKVSQACGVSTDALLVILQKEQGLVTASAPTASKFKIAMGYACPDTSACDTAYYGFYNQVYNAARQMKRYTNPAGTSNYFTWYPVGRPSNILWSPDASCGYQTITIENQATASLYYYTPYQPNQASLNAIWGTGDACSAYGNRNFWQYYNVWFNKDKSYETFVEWNGSVYIAVDDEGSVSTSSNLSSWIRKPPMNISNPVKKIVRDGQIKVILANGSVLTTTDGNSWTTSSYTAPTPPPTPTTTPTPNPTSPPADPFAGLVMPEAKVLRTVTSDASLNRRPQPTTTATADAIQLAANSNANIAGWVTGQSVSGINVWYKLSGVNLYSWAGGFTNSSTTGVPNLNPIAPPAGTATYYAVKAGDNVTSIATAYKTTPANIATWNKINTDTVLSVGQKVIVGYSTSTPTPTPTPTVTTSPKPTPTPTTKPVSNPIYYTIVSGDTMWGISNKYGKSIAQLMAWNSNITNAAQIYPGQRIIVGYSQ